MTTIIFFIVVVLICTVLIILSTRFSAFKEWLVFAVSESEKLFGGGTGQLKLRYVYDLAIKTFPALTKFISFNTFSKHVDEALEIMRDMLKHNEKINAIITDKEAE